MKGTSAKTHIRIADNLNWPVFIKEAESIINNIQKERALGPDGFTGKSTLKEEFIPILYNLIQRRETEGILPNSFCGASNTLI